MTQDKFIALARKGEGTQIEYKTESLGTVLSERGLIENRPF